MAVKETLETLLGGPLPEATEEETAQIDSVMDSLPTRDKMVMELLLNIMPEDHLVLLVVDTMNLAKQYMDEDMLDRQEAGRRAFLRMVEIAVETCPPQILAEVSAAAAERDAQQGEQQVEPDVAGRDV